MTPRIQILPEELCNKIAAGEVVERPSSVVKELVENSLDAGASDILVELEAGGKRLIRVSDNGQGMGRQDAFLAFERHATSKISSDQDLFALKTLGFRGEALASVASVSRLRLQTCDNQEGHGQEIYAEGGQIRKAQECGLPRGTRVEVRNLFFNLPARKKFLRKEQTELGHAADVVTKQALAHPAVSFHLKHNQRMLLDLRREKGLEERVAALLGRSLLRELLAVDVQSEPDLRLSGLISQPQLTRSAAAHIYTFINGRYIRDRVVQHAVMEGYRHLLMKGRYPVVVLFLELDPAEVDVNVHPTKHEVRFRQQALVHDFIVQAVRNQLRPGGWLAAEKNQPETPLDGSQSGAHPRPESRPEMSATDHVNDPVGIYVRNRATPSEGTQIPPAPATDSVPETEPVLDGLSPGGYFSSLQILGQYHQSYILCQDGDDLVLIDQHAAHERVGFEKLKALYAQGEVPSQELLFPEILELDFNSAAALDEQSEELQRLGFRVEPFGGNAFALKAVPQLLAGRSAAGLVVDVALELERIGRAGALRDSLDEVLILMACHSVIRANQALALPEIRALLQELDGIDFNAQCPHGRPVQKRLTLAEVERMFRRI